MDQRIKEQWVIPSIIALGVGSVLGVLFMVWGAWYTGIKLHALFSPAWVETIISVRLPMWVTLLTCAIGAVIFGMYRSQAVRVENEKSQKAALRHELKSAESQLEKANAEHAYELDKLKNPCPVLHMSWYGTSGWIWSGYETESVLSIQGDVTITMDNIQDKVTFISVHLEGAEYIGNFEPFKIDVGETTTRSMILNFRGLHPEIDRPLTVQLTFEDLKGKVYPTKPESFSALPTPKGYSFSPPKVPLSPAT
jgi:hypothetical protein